MPLAFTDPQMDVILRAAEPLHPQDRSAYLQRVADLLNGHELGDGLVSRAARQAQRELFRPPDDTMHTPMQLRKLARR
jgi:hypothetical protein